MSTAAINLVDMYRTLGEFEEALAAAQKVADADPDDVVAALDVAELSVTVGRLDDAVKAFDRVRAIEDLADHEVYALHGLVQVEIQRENWERALELTREASALDQHGRTNDVLAFLGGQLGEAPSEGRAATARGGRCRRWSASMPEAPTPARRRPPSGSGGTAWLR